MARGRDIGHDAVPPETRIALAGLFRFSHDAREEQLNAGGAWERLVPLLALRHRKISAATADREGHLKLTFVDGFAISAGPDPYENWELSGPGRLNLAAPPGGGDPRLST